MIIIIEFNLYKSRIKKLKKRFEDARVEGMWLPSIKYFKHSSKLTCSIEHIRKNLIKGGFVSHRTKRATKKAIKANLKRALEKTKDFEKGQQIISQIEIVDKHRIYQGKSGIAGFRIEVDGCFDHWFGKEKHCLYFAVDSFTGTILDLWIEKEETNIGYLNLFQGVFTSFGKPAEVRTDKRNGLAKGKISDAIKRLDIKIDSSTEPTFKPNVERSFQDAQSLLPNLFMDWKIDSPKELIERKKMY